MPHGRGTGDCWRARPLQSGKIRCVGQSSKGLRISKDNSRGRKMELDWERGQESACAWPLDRVQCGKESHTRGRNMTLDIKKISCKEKNLTVPTRQFGIDSRRCYYTRAVFPKACSLAHLHQNYLSAQLKHRYLSPTIGLRQELLARHREQFFFVSFQCNWNAHSRMRCTAPNMKATAQSAVTDQHLNYSRTVMDRDLQPRPMQYCPHHRLLTPRSSPGTLYDHILHK